TLSGDARKRRAPRLSPMTRGATGHQLLLALVLASVAAVLMAVAIHSATARTGGTAAHHRPPYHPQPSPLPDPRRGRPAPADPRDTQRRVRSPPSSGVHVR